MFIVGFTGKAGSGKDTAGMALVRQLGFERFAFADPIKAGLNGMFDFNPSRWQDREWKEAPLPVLGISPRKLAQTLGTEWGRELDTDFWVKVTESLITQSMSNRVVITDVRFDNEALWIRKQGGWVIELIRDKAAAVNEHVSEAGINPRHVDFHIVNDFKSVEALEKHVIREIQDKINMRITGFL
jgi:hypothetical protein